jgi:hypothetical protein
MSVFEPWAGQKIDKFTAPKIPNLNPKQFEYVHEDEQVEEPGTVRETPTPANTGAPTPGYRKRGPVNPSTTGAPMPKANTPQTPSVPVKPKGKKPTAPGTKPKKQ